MPYQLKVFPLHFWAGDIIGIDPIAYRMDQISRKEIMYGSAAGIWKSRWPHSTCWSKMAVRNVSWMPVVSVTDGLEYAAITLMEGALTGRPLILPYPYRLICGRAISMSTCCPPRLIMTGTRWYLPMAFGHASQSLKPVGWIDLGGYLGAKDGFWGSG